VSEVPSGFERAAPFLISILVLLFGLALAPALTRKVSKTADRWLHSANATDEERKLNHGRLARLLTYYTDASQLLGLMAPPLLGLAIGTTGGDGRLELLYATVLLAAFFGSALVLLQDPEKYGSVVGGRAGLTPVILGALLLNVVAAVVAASVTPST